MCTFNSHQSCQNKIENNIALEDNEKNSTKWEIWYKTLTNINLKDNVTKVYETIFGLNKFNFTMINNLNNKPIKPLNVDRTKHLIEILQAKSSQSNINALAITQSSLPISVSSKNAMQYCSEHLDTTAIDKCHRCKGSVCSDCRQQLSLGSSLVTYCDKCVDDVSCTIQ